MREDVPNIPGLAQAVVRHLPGYSIALPENEIDQWATKEKAYLIEGGGPYKRGKNKGLHFGQSWPRGRVSIGCLWPSDENGKCGEYIPRDSKSITVAADRNPEAIAKDIQRRLLAWYDAEWIAACNRMLDSNIKDAMRQTTADMFAEIMGPAVHRYENHGGGASESMRMGDVHVELHHSENASIKLQYAPIWVVEKVLRAMAGQGLFIPQCRERECFQPATKSVERHYGKDWYCDRHYAEMQAAEELAAPED